MAREGLTGAPSGAAAVDASKAAQSMRAPGAAAAGTGEPQAPTAKNIAGKTFYLDQESWTWIDSEYEAGRTEYKVEYLGNLYLALAARRPDIARWLSVGDKVKLRVGAVQLVIAPHIQDTLREDQIDALGG
jgi:hypothetical protein